MATVVGDYTLGERLNPQGGQTEVYNATHTGTGEQVVLKLPKPDCGPEEQARTQRELEILQSLDHPAVVRVVGAIPHGRAQALILEPIQGGTLREAIQERGRLPLSRFYELAISVAEALQYVHSRRLIHLDINPSNLMLDSRGQPRIIDFGLSTRVRREHRFTFNASSLLGTLPYLAPEQTGRTNRSVDYRADLYALGCTYYEMLTGRPPFEGNDPLRLVHHHVARTPVPVDQVEPTVPRSLARIVSKLLAKNAEDRYQSAQGLSQDLRRSLEAWQADVAGDFALGVDDVSALFTVPEVLLGRESEVEKLVGAWQSVDADRATLLLVRGYSGIGKSRLVREVQRPLSERAGSFVSGKFDQFQRHVPFAALRQALRDLVGQLLTRSPDALEASKARILDAIGGNGALLTESIPELAHLLGPQPEVAELPPQEARRRFDATLHAFLGAVCHADHPVVMFLDDLQWVDGATLSWLEQVLLAAQSNGLFLIGAYRDNEVDPSHPLSEALDRLRGEGAQLVEIELGPLDAQSIRELVAATLGRPDAEVQVLADVVHRRTGGNPFYATQLLESLHEQDAIFFDSETRRWAWDASAAAAAEASPNVVDLVVARLSRLPGATREALYVAACLGNRFATDTLRVAAARSELEVLQGIEEARAEGFVVRLRSINDSVEYAFLHDRVQQAAFSLHEDADGSLRRKIGWLMADAAEGDPDRLFGALQNLNPTRDRAEDKPRLGALNLQAAALARAATAYKPALEHIQVAIELGGESSAAVLERGWCEHLTGDTEAAEASFAQALALATDDDDAARAHEARVHFFTDSARFDEAYAAGREGAAHFGHSMPAGFVPPMLIMDLARVKFSLMGKSAATLVDLPEMSDERLKIGARIAAASLKAAYQIRPELCVHNAARLVQTCVNHGNFDDSPVGYLVLGSIFQGGVMGDHKAGFEWGQLAIDLIDKYDNAKQRAEILFVYGYFANSWTRPLTDTEAIWRDAWRAGQESGDLFHASCATSGITQNMFMRGAPLDQVEAECLRFLPFLERSGSVENAGTVRSVLGAVHALQGKTEAPWVLGGEDFDEAALAAALPDWGSKHFAHFYWVNRLATAVFSENWEAAERAVEGGTPYLADSAGMQHRVEYLFHQAMLAAARGNASQVRKQLKSFSRWASRCPRNFRHKELLLQAELDRLAGRVAKAFATYDLAAEDAAAQGFTQHEGLAALRAARFHQQQGNQRAARRVLLEAVDAWSRWGATALVEQLQTELPALLTGPRTGTTSRHTSSFRTGTTAGTRTSGDSGSMDAASLVRAGQALAQEVRLAGLLERMLDVVLEAAGAQRAVLLLKEEGDWRVEGERELDGTAAVLGGTPWREHPRLATTVVRYVLRTREALVVPELAKDDRFKDDPRAAEAMALLCMPLLNQGELRGLLYLENNVTVGGFTADRIAVLEVLTGQMAVSIENAVLYEQLERKVRERTDQLERRNQLIRQTFGRYLSDEVVDTLLESPRGLELGGDRKNITVLMSDLRGFTSMSERLTPEQVVQMLNNYLSVMTEIIFRHRGTIDEFLGDAILVVFGAPFERPDDAERAVRCAIEMQQAMGAVNAWNVAHALPTVEMGIGLHFGDAVVGNIGSERRTKYGVVGQTVNIASRVESYTVGGQVLVSEAVHEAVGGLRVRGSFQVEPKGVSKPMTIYEVDGIEADKDYASADVPLARLPLIPLSEPLMVKYRPLSGKDVVATPIDARVVALSESEAILVSSHDEVPLTNLRVELLTDSGSQPDPIYAKVGLPHQSITGTRVRFTAVSDEARAILYGHMKRFASSTLA